MNNIDRLIDKVANDLAAALKLVKQVKFNGDRTTPGTTGYVIDIDIYRQTIRNAQELYQICLRASRFPNEDRALAGLQSDWKATSLKVEQVESKIKKKFGLDVPSITSSDSLPNAEHAPESDIPDASSSGVGSEPEEENGNEGDEDEEILTSRPSEAPEQVSAARNSSPDRSLGNSSSDSMLKVIKANEELAQSKDLVLPALTAKAPKDQEGQNGAAPVTGNSSSEKASNQGNVSGIPQDVLRAFMSAD